MATAAVLPPPPAEITRCAYVVPNKGRRCRFPVLPGSAMCGAHQENADEGRNGARIPCPLDPNHTVFEKRLKQHLKICTKVRDQSVVESQPFFRRGINMPAPVALEAKQSPPTPSTSSTMEPVSTAPEGVALAWRARIEAAWPKAVREVLGPSFSPEELLARSVVTDGAGLAHAEKHEVQNQALAELMVQAGLLSKATAREEVVLVEYGSGKGGLAAAALECCPGVRCVLVEREPRRHKFENKHDKREEQVLRLRVDIADFDLGGFLGPALEAAGLPRASDFRSDALSLSGAAGCLGPAERLEELWRMASEFQSSGTWPPVRLGACAKHLCGGATDIALRSLKEAQRQPLKHGPCFGVCIATCCHHRCDPKSYVNRPFLADLGLCQSPEEFSQFVSTAGWAVGGDGARDVEKRRVGMMAKRILDLGRVAWLRQELQLGDATLTDYIDKAVTPENIAILAGARAGHKTRAGVWGLRWLACCGWCR
ncbi:TRM13 [Symbiodinium sp. CCMP2592]|nr:TRM13 [Symbiodinium sp. CCMP2592]